MPLFALSCSCLTLTFDAGTLLTLFFAPSATFRPSARCHPRRALDRASVHLHALCCCCCYAVRLLTLLLHARKGLSHALLPSNLSAGHSISLLCSTSWSPALCLCPSVRRTCCRQRCAAGCCGRWAMSLQLPLCRERCRRSRVCSLTF